MESSRKTTELLPAAETKIIAFETRCGHVGIDVLITSTYRDGEAQHELWKIGREIPGAKCHCNGLVNEIGSCPRHPLGLTVTNADAGQSFHQYRVAADFCPLVNGKPVWNDPALHERCGEIAESLGLSWAGRWEKFKELAHVQFTNGLTLKDFQAGKTF